MPNKVVFRVIVDRAPNDNYAGIIALKILEPRRCPWERNLLVLCRASSHSGYKECISDVYTQSLLLMTPRLGHPMLFLSWNIYIQINQ